MSRAVSAYRQLLRSVRSSELFDQASYHGPAWRLTNCEGELAALLVNLSSQMKVSHVSEDIKALREASDEYH